MGSETRTRVTANAAELVTAATAANQAQAGDDFVKAAQYWGRASATLDDLMNDAVAIAPDSEAVQAAFDNAKAGADF